jgi:hypothetical protein
MVFGILMAGAVGGIVGGVIDHGNTQTPYFERIKPDLAWYSRFGIEGSFDQTLQWITDTFRSGGISFQIIDKELKPNCSMKIKYNGKQSPTITADCRFIWYSWTLIDEICSNLYKLVDDSKKDDVKRIWLHELIGYHPSYPRPYDSKFLGLSKEYHECAEGYRAEGNRCVIDYNHSRWKLG